MKCVIIGIGQVLRGDDAAGIEAVKRWREAYTDWSCLPALKVELAELPGIGLLDLIEGAEAALLVDAVRSGSRAGTVYTLDEDDLEAFVAGSGSAHGWGVGESLALGRRMEMRRLPDKISIIGIEVGSVDMGEGLSAEVTENLDEAIRMIQKWVEETLKT